MGDTTRRYAILQAFVARLCAVTVANGFATDAGAKVFLGEGGELGDGDPDQAIAVVVGDDDATFVGEQVAVRLPIAVQALVKVDLDQPQLVIEQVLGDIKRAIELTDRTLGGVLSRGQRLTRGATRTVDRQPGSLTVGVGVTYYAPYLEVWGQP